jgi:hypothetical protein
LILPKAAGCFTASSSYGIWPRTHVQPFQIERHDTASQVADAMSVLLSSMQGKKQLDPERAPALSL